MARSFNNSTSTAITVAAAPVGALPFTIAAWFNTNSALNGGVDQTIVHIHVVGGNLDSIGVDIQGSNGHAAAYIFNDSTTSFINDSGFLVVANTWYPVLWVCTSTTSRTIYVKNSATSNTDATNMGTYTAQATNTDIGRFNGNSLFSPMNGSLAEMAMWNVALSPAEVAAYCGGARASTIRPASLKYYDPLDGYGHPALDRSIYARTGTLVGTTTLTLGPPKISAAPFFSSLNVKRAAAVASSVVFRKTLSSIGTRTGTRQAQA